MENTQGSSNKSMFNKNRSTRSHSSMLTLRILLLSREIGNVIGKTINTIRHQSSARIKINNVLNQKYIVKITGTPDTICQATELIGLKIQEYFGRRNGDQNRPRRLLTVTLIMPIYQCGFIIGKRGSEINRIRRSSGADIQIASGMLPNSNQRLVSITGTTGRVSQCVHQMCITLLNSSPYTVTNSNRSRNMTSGLVKGRLAVGLDVERRCYNLVNVTAAGLETASTESVNPAALAALGESQLRTGNYQNHNVCGQHINQNETNSKTTSMTVPYNLIRYFIDNNSGIVEEIQRASGAVVHIAKLNGTLENGENDYWQIIITGNKYSISIAKNIIEMQFNYIIKLNTIHTGSMLRSLVLSFNPS